MAELSAIESKLNRYQSTVTFGLGFIVLFAVTASLLMLWQMTRVSDTREKVAEVALTTKASLCSLQHDIEARKKDSEQYLADNPRGLVGADGRILITAATIQRGIDAQAATLDALRAGGLEC
jgi:hypothetical protein